MKKIILLIYLFLAGILQLHSQEAVVSEIFIATGANSEWTELLIIQDNVSLVGYSIRDNGSEGAWMGGIRFRDVDLWKNLRVGTIIIIYHRGGVIDDNKADGYIELGALSSFYFDTFLPDGSPGSLDINDTGSSLNFNTTHDMIQLRNSKNEHVHCLGYIGNGNFSVYDQLPSTKAFHNQGVSQNTSIKIAPGSDLSAYSAGISSLQVTNAGVVTKGLPNKRSTTEYLNQLYWRELRQPIWNNPGIIATNIVNNYQWVELKWNAASTISDPVEGFMILRYVDNNNNPLTLDDGKIYNVGQQIGPYKVIGIVETLAKGEFIDKFEDGVNFECGRYYGYQVYAYRYKQSDMDPQTYDYNDPRNARGRQYNEVNFASVAQSIRKEIPPVPAINTDTGVLKFCSNVKVNLIASIIDKVKYNYQWFSSSDGLLPVNDNILPLTKAGDYWLKLVDKSSGCSSESNNIKIEILQAPESFIINSADNKTFANDTLIQICTGKQLNLRGLSLPSGSNVATTWTKDNAFFNSNNDVIISTDGLYKFISVTGGLCPDTSITVQVRFVSPDYIFDKSNVVFDADSSPEQDIIVTNNSETDLTLNSSDFILTPLNNYKILSPTVFPVTIPAKGKITVRIRFEMIGYGERLGKFTINSFCNFSKTADLNGSRQNIGTTRLDPDLKDIDFGILPTKCNLDQNDTLVKVISTGTENTSLYKPRLQTTAFEVVSNLFNTAEQRTTVPAGQNIEFGIKVIATTPGIYFDTLTAPYIIQGKTDTTGYITIALKVELYDPSIEIVTKFLDFSENVSCKKSLDTFIVVRNSSRTDITISDDFDVNGKASILDKLPIIIKSNTLDTINIRLVFGSLWGSGLNFKYYNPCLLLSDYVMVIPPSKELEITFEKDTVDFGIINNCITAGEIVKPAIIKASAEGGSIGKILYSGTQIKSDLFEGKILLANNNSFDLRLPANAIGVILDSLVFMVEPCNEKYVLYIKANRITPPKPGLSTTTVDFGTNFILNADTRTLTVLNENADLPIKIDSLIVPLPFELISHTKADFPIVIPPSGTLDFRFEFKRVSSGQYNVISKMFVSEPCKQTLDITTKGISIDDRTATFKALLPTSETIDLGKEKRIPIKLEFDTKYTNRDVDIRRMSFYLTYDFLTMNLRAAVPGNSMQSATSNLLFDDTQNGKLVLTLNVTESDKLLNGDFLILTAKPLLGNSTKSKISLDSVVVLSKLAAIVETNESEVTITGECELDTRLVTVGGSVGITVRNSENSELIFVDFSIISDERTEILLYDMQGNLVNKLVNSYLKPGDYTSKINYSELSNGIYLLVLKNGIRHNSVSFPILK
jgi:hypothetical protein